MYLCSDCKERERSYTWVGSSGHCDNKRCENYYPEINTFTIVNALPNESDRKRNCVEVTKRLGKLKQPRITFFFPKL